MCVNKPNQNKQIELNFEEQPEFSPKSALRLSSISSFIILVECFLSLYLKNIILNFWHPYVSVKNEKLVDNSTCCTMYTKLNIQKWIQESDFHLLHWKTTHQQDYNYPYFFRKKIQNIYISRSFPFKNRLIKKWEKMKKKEKNYSALSSCSSNKTEIQWMKFSQENQW